MEVLVTGGAGYVGFSLVRALAQRTDIDRILVVDSLASANYGLFVNGSHGPVPVEFRRIDILDGYGLDAVLDGIDTVFHLAAHTTTSFVDSQVHSFDQINHWGSAQLARSIEGTNSVERVVYLSSFAVYGSSDEPATEATEPEPTSAYGISKLNGEAQLARLASKRDVWIVRAANAFGANPAFRLDTVINTMAFDAWTERRIRIDGDGTQMRPFIEIDSLGQALVDLPGSGAPPGIYNMATHNATINELAGIIKAIVADVDVFHASRDVRMQRIAVELPVALNEWIQIPIRPLPDAIGALIETLAGNA